MDSEDAVTSKSGKRVAGLFVGVIKGIQVKVI